MELSKALYGTLRVALLFWKLLTSKLVEWGFEINPYDWCVANKIIDGKQCTICFHVDDLKILHVCYDVVSQVIKLIDDEFGKLEPMSVMRGKQHEYLGMELDYSMPGKVRISMSKFVEELLDMLPQDMCGYAMTPAGENLFMVRSDKD